MLLLAFYSNTHAITLEGKIVKILDGDTVHLLVNNKVIRVRLAGVDAPEKSQAYGKKSKKYLADFIGNQVVTVYYNKRDKYGRVIGSIFLDRFDINLAMIRAGFAWHFKRYQKEQTLLDRLAYAGTEREARLKKLGLWNGENPIPPWDWRKQRKNRL